MAWNTAIERKPHLEELELTNSVYSLGRGHEILLDGGSGKKAIIPAALAPYLRRSIDIDVIMKGNAAKSMLGGIKLRNMVDRVVYNNDAAYCLLSPFTVISNIENIDIFTESTGVGPIRVTREVFDRAYSVWIDRISLNARLPDISFVAATSMNPVVQKRSRVVPALVAMLAGMHGFDVQEAIERSISYMLEGSESIREALSNARGRNDITYRHVLHDPNYVEYERRISTKLPNVIHNNRERVLHLALKIGIGRDETDRFLEMYVKKLRRA